MTDAHTPTTQDPGRPHYPIYDPIDFPRMAYVACSEGGLTNEGLARMFGVSRNTVQTWMREHDAFRVAIRSGKDEFDSREVEKATLKRALGYDYVEEVEEWDSEAGAYTVTKRTKKHLPGDVTAQRFWLKNRDPERWPDTNRTEGTLDVAMSHEEMLDELDRGTVGAVVATVAEEDTDAE